MNRLRTRSDQAFDHESAEIGFSFREPISSTQDRRIRQSYFSELGKAAPNRLLKLFFRNNLLFEPEFTPESFGEYLIRHSEGTMEIVYHNLFHLTFRVGSIWFDFHWEGGIGTKMIRKINRLDLGRVGRAVARVRNMVSHYGLRNGKEIGIGMCLTISELQQQRLIQALTDFPMPVDFHPLAQDGGETCVTLLTKIIEQTCPELNIRRTKCFRALMLRTLGRHQQLRLISIYSNSTYSQMKLPMLRLAQLGFARPSSVDIDTHWKNVFPVAKPTEVLSVDNRNAH